MMLLQRAAEAAAAAESASAKGRLLPLFGESHKRYCTQTKATVKMDVGASPNKAMVKKYSSMPLSVILS